MKDLGHRSMSLSFALRAMLSRPWLSIPVPVDSIILRDSLTEVELTLKGWGWLRIRPLSAPRFIPTARRFFWQPTTLWLTVPVGDAIAVSATNIWGVKRLRFSIAATSSVAPKVACLPELSLPTAVKQMAIARPSMTLRPDMKAPPVDWHRLSTGRMYRRLQLLSAITGAPAQLPVDMKRALHELNSDQTEFKP